jgi:hypothetical protein
MSVVIMPRAQQRVRERAHVRGLVDLDAEPRGRVDDPLGKHQLEPLGLEPTPLALLLELLLGILEQLLERLASSVSLSRSTRSASRRWGAWLARAFLDGRAPCWARPEPSARGRGREESSALIVSRARGPRFGVFPPPKDANG